MRLSSALLVLVAAGCSAGPAIDERNVVFPVQTPLAVRGDQLLSGGGFYRIDDLSPVGGLPATTPFQVLEVDGDRVYAGGAAAVEVFDLSDPSSPVHLGRKDHDEMFRGTVTDLEIDERGVLWVVTGGDAVTMDVSDPANLVSLAVHDIGPTLQIDGDVGYTVSGYGLGVWDLSGPSPQLLHYLAHVRDGRGTFPAAHVRGNYAAIAIDGRLHLYTRDDPRDPQLIATIGDNPDDGLLAFEESVGVHIWNEHATLVQLADGTTRAVRTSDGGAAPFEAHGRSPSNTPAMASNERYLVYEARGGRMIVEELLTAGPNDPIP